MNFVPSHFSNLMSLVFGMLLPGGEGRAPPGVRRRAEVEVVGIERVVARAACGGDAGGDGHLLPDGEIGGELDRRAPLRILEWGEACWILVYGFLVELEKKRVELSVDGACGGEFAEAT